MKAVLFDLDGTLIDSSEGITKSVRYTLDYFGMEENDEQVLRTFIGPPLIDSFEKIYGFTHEKALKAVEKYRERYNAIGIFECSLYPGVQEILRKLKEQGYRIGMASSKPEISCRRILAHFDILKYFDDVVGATMDGTINSKEEVLAEVFRRWSDLSADEMCLIGDTMFDVNGANAYKIPCIAVSFGFGDVEEMTAAGAVLCNRFSEIPELIHKL